MDAPTSSTVLYVRTDHEGEVWCIIISSSHFYLDSSHAQLSIMVPRGKGGGGRARPPSDRSSRINYSLLITSLSRPLRFFPAMEGREEVCFYVGSVVPDWRGRGQSAEDEEHPRPQSNALRAHIFHLVSS